MYLYLHGFKRIYGYAIMRCPVIPKPLVVYKMVVYEKNLRPGKLSRAETIIKPLARLSIAL